MPYQKALTILGSLVLIGIASCGGQVSQCRQLVAPINDSKDFVRQYEQDMDGALSKFSSAQNLEGINAAAEAYMSAVETVRRQNNELAQEISALEIADEQLNEYRGQYITVITQWSDALTTARDAMQELTTASTEEEVRNTFARFQAKTDSAYSALQVIDTQEAALVEGINTYCEASVE